MDSGRLRFARSPPIVDAGHWRSNLQVPLVQAGLGLPALSGDTDPVQDAMVRFVGGFEQLIGREFVGRKAIAALFDEWVDTSNRR